MAENTLTRKPRRSARPIPKEIFSVPRPKNTIVCAYGKTKTVTE